MATISGYDSSSLGVLFSGLNSSQSKSSLFGNSDLLGISYNDYATIQNGSYSKLMKAYYAKDSSDAVSSSVSSITSTSVSKDSTAVLGKIESASDDLSDAAEKLRANGDKSLFTKVQTTDADGKVSYDYDKDKIYKAVSEFVDSYNDVIKQAGDSNTSNISRSAKSLVNTTKANAKLLSSVGITIGTDNKLSIDETAFKKADMNSVKSLFHTTGSYGYQAGVQANMINQYAKNEAEKANTYGKTGTYTYNYSTGQIYNNRT